MEVIGHIEGLIWSANDAKVVADFLTGKNISVITQDRQLEWEKLKRIIEAGGRPTPKQIQNTPTQEVEKEAYEWSTQKRATTVLSIVEVNLRNHGIWGHDEGRQIATISGLRDRGNFSEDELTGNQITDLGYISTEEGGPHIIGKISIPKAEATKRRTDERIRRSLAHEVSHYIRALTNKNFWKGFENEAEKHGLRQSTDPIRKKIIGGFYVGSNQQGSESVGELFSKAVEIEASGKKATIENVLSELKPASSNNSDYSVSMTALYDHLKQLRDSGLGNLHCYDIVALVTFGYTSYEKLPSLIRLGILDQEKLGKMKKVIRNIGNWLTDSSVQNTQ